MKDTIYLVVRDIHYGQNWPEKTFESEEDAEEWRDKKADEYRTEIHDSATNYLIGEKGTKFRLRVIEVDYHPAKS